MPRLWPASNSFDMTMTIYTIDATGRSLGRVASEAASKLLGKETGTYQKHLVSEVRVEIVNAAKLKTTPKKMRQETYRRYSGYPGGLKFSTLGELVTKKGWPEALRIAIKGMLPKNKLQDERMQRLIIHQ